MTNEEKIEELAEKSPINWISKEDKCTYRQGFVCGATKIAKWKDEQHEQEKQQWIDNACEWWTNNWRKYVMTDKDGIVALNFWKGDFKQAMKGEQQQ